MEAGPAKKKLKSSGDKDGASSAESKKAWHMSKKLLKRVAFLLDNPDIIPTDICFQVGEGAISDYIHGHKIFFALSSPVFHAMFYGSIKLLDNVVDVPDITPEAFRCLVKYAYADDTASITVSNVMDVLVASQKYLMAKLTRYCYEFVQENLTAKTACFFWKKARLALAEIVEKQSIAEIKRNTAEAIYTRGFLELPDTLIIELTSWNDLTTCDPNLLFAVQKWKKHQEKAGRHVKFDREDGGVLQHIRFALFPFDRLAIEQAEGKIFSAEDFQELCLYKMVNKELTSFSALHRTPMVDSFRLSLSLFASKTNSTQHQQLLGRIVLSIMPDMAPKACRVLRQYVENKYNFQLSFTVDSPDIRDDDSTMMFYRQVRRGTAVEDAVTHPLTDAMKDIEESSGLWSSANSVCFKFSEEEPHMPELTVLNTSLTTLGGKLPESVFGQSSRCGVVIGKVLEGPIDKVRKLAAFEYQTCVEFGVSKKERTWEDKFFVIPSYFRCALWDD